jgi:hypothetical protein
VEDVLLVILIVFFVGVFVGARYIGGPFYLRRLTESEHQTRLSRVGLKK